MKTIQSDSSYRNQRHFGRVLALLVAFAGCTAFGAIPEVEGDTLVFDIPAGEPFTYGEVIESGKSIVKKGAGTLILTGDSHERINSISIEAGVLKADGDRIRNGSTLSITVAKDAQLDMTGWTQGDWTLCAGSLTIAGDGPDGTGALIRRGKTAASLFGSITLSDDATINLENQTGPSNGGVVLNGHKLTKVGNGALYFYSGRQMTPDKGDAPFGSFRMSEGSFRSGAKGMNGSANNVFTLAGGTYWMEGAADASPMPWTLDVVAGATIKAEGAASETSTLENGNAWSGPVYLTNGLDNSTLRIETSNDRYVVFKGPFVATNNAISCFNQWGAWGKAIFRGPTEFYISYNDWTKTHTWMGGSIFDGCPTLRLRGILNNGAPYAPWYILNCPAVTLDGGSKYINGPSLASPVSISITNSTVTLNGVATIGSNAATMGSAVDVRDSAIEFQHTLAVGGSSRGAFYGRNVDFKGNPTVVNNETDYGAFILNGGSYYAYTGTTVGLGGYGSMYLTNVTAEAAVANGYKFTVGCSTAGAAFRMSGGTLTAKDVVVTSADASDGCETVFVLENGASLVSSSFCNMASTNATTTIMAFNSGASFQSGRLQRTAEAVASGKAKWYMNFDGGVIKPSYQADWHGGSSNGPDAHYVHEGGVVVDGSALGEGENASVGGAFLAPTGMIVKEISLPTDAAFANESYLGAPKVTISGAGTGAAAIAVFDPETRKVTGIDVVAKGSGYDANTTATIMNGTGDGTFSCAVTCVDAPTTGVGVRLRGKATTTFTLPLSSTYHGPTEIESGILNLNYATQVPTYNFIIRSGAMLDLKSQWFAKDAGLSMPTLKGAGTITNGNVQVTGTLTLGLGETTPLRITGDPNDTTTIPGKLTLANGATIVLEQLAAFDPKSDAELVLVEAAGGIVRKGTVDITGVPDEWKVRISASTGRITATRKRGLAIIVR